MLQCSFLSTIKEIIIFMASCKLVIGNYKGLYLACIIQTYGCPLVYGAFLATTSLCVRSMASTYLLLIVDIKAVQLINIAMNHSNSARIKYRTVARMNAHAHDMLSYVKTRAVIRSYQQAH